MRNGLLHKESAPSIKYPYGFSVWSLNGVRVPQWLVETRDIDIDPKKMLEIENAEVRREFVRKVGIERIYYKLGGECLDKVGDYELVVLDIGDDRKRPYLKMLNPSIDTWHLEGVHPDCKTVESALNWRNQSELKPEILT